MFDRLKNWARLIKRDVLALYFASRDPRVPWYAKAFALVVAGYALSPLDLIPDFIPILGYLDDMIILPVGILIAIRLVSSHLLSEHRELAATAAQRPVSSTAAMIIAVIWASSLILMVWLAYPFLKLTPNVRV